MIETSLARHWFMHTRHAAVGLAVGAKVRAGQLPPPGTTPLPPASPQAKLPMERPTLRVGLIAGPEAAWDLAAARVAEHLRKDQNFDVYHAWDFVELGIDDPTHYDCLVLLGWPAADHDHAYMVPDMAPGRERVKRIERHCRGGGSLVAVRAMHAEIPGWPDFAEEVLGGRQPACRRSRLLEVQRSDTAWHHPVVDGVETMIAEGEVYSGPRFSPDTTVLLTADGGQGVQPVAWTTRHQGGRVFCTTLGLDDDFREPSFLRLISNAVQWAGLVHAP